MLIEVNKGVYWDTEAQTQSAEAYAWMREQNLARMAMGRTTDSSMIAQNLMSTNDLSNGSLSMRLALSRSSVSMYSP